MSLGRRPAVASAITNAASAAIVAVALSASVRPLVGQTLLSIPALPGVPVREGFVRVAPDVQLFYRLAGDGTDPIVFVHGGPGLGFDDGGYDLEGIAARGHSFLMVNERGAGRSTVITDAKKLGLDNYVDDLEAVRRHFGLSGMKLLGLSFGSAIVASYAARYPNHVSRIVFLSPMALTRELGRARLRRRQYPPRRRRDDARCRDGHRRHDLPAAAAGRLRRPMERLGSREHDLPVRRERARHRLRRAVPGARRGQREAAGPKSNHRPLWHRWRDTRKTLRQPD